VACHPRWPPPPSAHPHLLRPPVETSGNHSNQPPSASLDEPGWGCMVFDCRCAHCGVQAPDVCPVRPLLTETHQRCCRSWMRAWNRLDFVLGEPNLYQSRTLGLLLRLGLAR
jgi:hypothetical protein